MLWRLVGAASHYVAVVSVRFSIKVKLKLISFINQLLVYVFKKKKILIVLPHNEFHISKGFQIECTKSFKYSVPQCNTCERQKPFSSGASALVSANCLCFVNICLCHLSEPTAQFELLTLTR